MRRLLHFWEVRNVKKGEELIMGVNMVLVDDNVFDISIEA